MTPTVIFVGLLVVLYTVVGGSKAVSYTHKYQMFVILFGLLIVFFYLTNYIFDFLTIGESFNIIKAFNKNNAINFSFDIKEKYTIWSGLLGGFFFSHYHILVLISLKFQGILMLKILKRVG